MGLDAVELMMELEESFGLQIPDEAMSEVRTVGDLYSKILQILNSQKHSKLNPEVCLTSATFCWLRRHLAPTIKESRSIRPRMKLVESLPSESRIALWKKLASETNLRFPALVRPSWLVLMICCVTSTAAVMTFLSMPTTSSPGHSAFMGVFSAACTGTLLTVATARFKILPEPGWSTYRGLVESLVAMNYAALSKRFQSIHAQEVWNVLQKIIVETLHVKPEQVTRDADFVKDLLLD